MKTTNIKSFSSLLLLTIALLVSSCSNLEKLVDRGDYDRAVFLAVKNLSGKTKKKQKHVTALEKGFLLATKRDMKNIDQLKLRNDVAAWEKINAIAHKIDGRQDMIQPLLPVIDREGYKANFKFVRIAPIIAESEDKAASLLFDEAKDWLTIARNGDKSAAREAYYSFERLKGYKIGYENSRALQHEARELGIVNVVYAVDARSGLFIPSQVIHELERLGATTNDDFWTRIYTNPSSNVDLDYAIEVVVEDLEIGPSLVREREFTESKEISDGYELLVTEMTTDRDSVKTEKVEKFKTVYADVLETTLRKEVFVSARVQLINLSNNSVIFTDRQRVSESFTACGSTFLGDRRALSPNTLNHLNNGVLDFPHDEVMVRNATCKLRPNIESGLNRVKSI